MITLAFDTTSEAGGVGIFRDAECLVAVPNQGPADGYSITLFQMVEQALTLAHLELAHVDLYAVANGPGSFTGIRVGLAAAGAWGKVFTRPVRGISILQAMANRVLLTSDWAVPVMDARRGEFFVGGFRRSKETPDDSRQRYELVDAGWILKPESLRAFGEERLAGGATATCVVRAQDQNAVDLRAVLPQSLGWQAIDGTLLDSIAALARMDELSNRACPEAQLDAYYIRRPDAEVKRPG